MNKLAATKVVLRFKQFESIDDFEFSNTEEGEGLIQSQIEKLSAYLVQPRGNKYDTKTQEYAYSYNILVYYKAFPEVNEKYKEDGLLNFDGIYEEMKRYYVFGVPPVLDCNHTESQFRYPTIAEFKKYYELFKEYTPGLVYFDKDKDFNFRVVSKGQEIFPICFMEFNTFVGNLHTKICNHPKSSSMERIFRRLAGKKKTTDFTIHFFQLRKLLETFTQECENDKCYKLLPNKKKGEKYKRKKTVLNEVPTYADHSPTKKQKKTIELEKSPPLSTQTVSTTNDRFFCEKIDKLTDTVSSLKYIVEKQTKTMSEMQKKLMEFGDKTKPLDIDNLLIQNISPISHNLISSSSLISSLTHGSSPLPLKQTSKTTTTSTSKKEKYNNHDFELTNFDSETPTGRYHTNDKDDGVEEQPSTPPPINNNIFNRIRSYFIDI
ncbi:hypothetical protein CYY_005250 [Polysphondylium violaceum]|uniref:Uncharacterized protein n=1 Tax=Polysphondylium violaceum TaxID=133409 RepID=A0A8J4PT89_9MYCE|nr:hypothetical protein CYY_005250 [Polysphondylium violaceum]